MKSNKEKRLKSIRRNLLFELKRDNNFIKTISSIGTIFNLFSTNLDYKNSYQYVELQLRKTLINLVKKEDIDLIVINSRSLLDEKFKRIKNQYHQEIDDYLILTKVDQNQYKFDNLLSNFGSKSVKLTNFLNYKIATSAKYLTLNEINKIVVNAIIKEISNDVIKESLKDYQNLNQNIKDSELSSYYKRFIENFN